MTKELKQALRTIAEYDGLTLRDDTFWMDPDEERSGYWENIIHTRYHTSADALLPVWRKVRDEYTPSKIDMVQQARISRMYMILGEIGDGNYPEACIKLAEIIEQLKPQTT